MEVEKREVELIVLSDIHLGTYGCHASELLKYLKSINPKHLILNGDIVDIWQFNKRYWPAEHMMVIKHLTGLIANGVRVDYITGNHDEMLRKFVGFKMGSFSICNKLLLKLNGDVCWFFHGVVFDVTMQHSRWLAKLGAIGYDFLILVNRLANHISQKLGKGRMSLSKKIKNSVKSAVKFISDFEQTAAGIAIDNKYQAVICGHIHQPIIKQIENKEGSVLYLNSGDWIENLSALEYNKGAWQVYEYLKDTHAQNFILKDKKLNTKKLFTELIFEFNSMHSLSIVEEELSKEILNNDVQHEALKKMLIQQ
jgi:UDP-2,3-diacylglucosamine pyrophosphatase LpxH